MLHVIAYDIPDDRRRGKVAQALRDFGFRTQKSVFELRLDEARLRVLRTRLERLIDPRADSVRVYRLCAACEKTILLMGSAQLTDDPNVIII